MTTDIQNDEPTSRLTVIAAHCFSAIIAVGIFSGVSFGVYRFYTYIQQSNREPALTQAIDAGQATFLYDMGFKQAGYETYQPKCVGDGIANAFKVSVDPNDPSKTILDREPFLSTPMPTLWCNKSLRHPLISGPKN